MNSQFYIAAVINAILWSIVLPAVDNADELFCIASPMPDALIAKLLLTALNLSAMDIALSASILNAFIVEIMLWEDSDMSDIPSATFL